MNHTQASCGCTVVAVGAPGSIARMTQESYSCGKPRCRSRLPDKFTDEECEALCWLQDCRIRWSVDMITKKARDHTTSDPVEYGSLVELAKAKGWKQ